MALSPGTLLGPYYVIAQIGAGGMGEVYRARDTRLDRLVAIKILAASHSHDPDRRIRFEREARVIALLSHPNICTLHDVGRSGEVDFLVMEHLVGETLAARLGRGPLPLSEALAVAAQIADALTAAHRAGVVHRDLKPSNVMLGAAGVKVLDFGLAKLRAASAATASTDERTLTRSPHDPLTDAKALLGTLPYMAPEQLEARQTDERTDLFALGNIIYEMTTGRRAFEGASQAALIAAILACDPSPMSMYQPRVSPALERLVRKCLAKEPATRWQSASDVADELRWLATASVSPPSATPAAPTLQRAVALAAAVVVVMAATAVVWLWLGERSNPGRDVVHNKVTFVGDVLNAALSPDGRTVAYAAGRDLDVVRVFARDLAGPEPLQLWQGTRVGDLKWLPDGSQLIVTGNRDGAARVWLVPRLGGPGRELGNFGYLAAPSPDGSEVALAFQDSPGVYLAPVRGGPRRLLSLTTGLQTLFGITWNDRANLLVIPTRIHTGEEVVWTMNPAGQNQRRLYTGTISSVCDSPAIDALYLFADQRLLRVPLTSATTAPPRTLLSGLPPTRSEARTCTVSADGRRMLHVRRTAHANLWSLDLMSMNAPPRPLTEGTAEYGSPAISPDGRWVAFTAPPDGIWRMPVAGGERVPLAFGLSPAWSPDGRRLAWFSNQEGAKRLWVGDADGRNAEQIDSSDVPFMDQQVLTWLGDERLAWPVSNGNHRIRDLSTGREEYLINGDPLGYVFVAQLSPQRDSVAVFRNYQSVLGLWIVSWADRVEHFLAANLVPAGWSADGEWIYAHQIGSRTIVKVSATSGEVRAVGTFPVGRLEGLRACSVLPDGTALVCSLSEATTDAWLIENFDPQASWN